MSSPTTPNPVASQQLYLDLLMNYGHFLHDEGNSSVSSLNSTANLFSSNFSSAHLSASQQEMLIALKQLFSSVKVYSPFTEFLLILSYGIIAITGFISNAFIIFVIISSSKLLRNPSTVLLLNLMVGDLIMSVFCIPFTVIWFIRRSWTFGWILCRLIPLIQGISIFTSSSTIAVIAIDRLLRVTRQVPLNSYCLPGREYEWVQIWLETLLIWSLSFFLALPAWFSQELIVIGFPPALGYTKCVETMPAKVKTLYSVLVVVIQYFVPTLVLLIVNNKIKDHLESRLHSWSNGLAITMNESNGRHILQDMRRNRKVLRTLVRIAVAFMVAWLPWNIANLYIDSLEEEESSSSSSSSSVSETSILASLSPDSMNLLLAVFHLIAMTSIPINAFLYGWLNPSVRNEAFRIWNLIPKPSFMIHSPSFPYPRSLFNSSALNLLLPSCVASRRHEDDSSQERSSPLELITQTEEELNQEDDDKRIRGGRKQIKRMAQVLQSHEKQERHDNGTKQVLNY